MSANKTNRRRTDAEPKAAGRSASGSNGGGATMPSLSLPNFMQHLTWLKIRKTLGLFLVLFSAFLLIAFVSHLFTGLDDQSVVDQGLDQPAHASNITGRFGAELSFLFITSGFGFIALLIPIYGLFLGYALVENRGWIWVRRLFFPVFFLLYWVAASFGFILLLFELDLQNLSGQLGLSLNEWLALYIGMPGVAFVLVFSLAAFVAFRFNRFISLGTTLDNVFKLFRGKSSDTAPDRAAGNSLKDHNILRKDKNKEQNGSAENPDPQADSKKDEDDFIINVRRVGEPAEADTDAVAEAGHDLEMLEDSLDDELPPVGFQQDLAAAHGQAPFPAAVPHLPKSGVFKPIIQGEFSVANDAAASADGFEIEIPRDPEPVADLPAPAGNNLYAFAPERFARVVPEPDQETLDEDEELVSDWELYDPTRELSTYQFPTLELLRTYDRTEPAEVDRDEIRRNKDMIVETLQNFKIEITSIKATVGPTVTLYEIVPAPHIRINKVKVLEDDIAMRLKALRSRIIAPMPAKGTIGIEVPNSRPEIVAFRSLIATEKFKNSTAQLPIAVGKTVSNEVYIADLAKMPHLLVAGATGQGKSVGLNCMIASLLYKKHPSQLKFVLIDPKKVEMTLYEALQRHYLATLPDVDEAIITDTKQALTVLNSLCLEMDNRYELLKAARVRNITEYNAKFMARKLNPHKGHRFLPYIVLIIDELADLMMTAGKEVEPPICRLAQLARAIGIHLIVATQRPSVDIITGKIKTNFPARVAYRVSSKIDSRTILDGNGAEQLIGKGDLLISEGNDLIRVQNAFIDTDEIESLVEFISNQRGYPTAYLLPEYEGDNSDGSFGEGSGGDGEWDDMFAEAARLVVAHQQGSTSLIQRRMKLGYNRAGRIMDQLERAGIVGSANGSKARDVLFRDEIELERHLEHHKFV